MKNGSRVTKKSQQVATGTRQQQCTRTELLQLRSAQLETGRIKLFCPCLPGDRVRPCGGTGNVIINAGRQAGRHEQLS